jgi:hypothetical protein
VSHPAEITRAFGFSRTDWVRSGAFTDEHFERILGSLALGEDVMFTSEAWMKLAQLSPGHARKVWESVGERWLAGARRMKAAALSNPPGFGGPEALGRIVERQQRHINRLRQLAGLNDIEQLP